MNYQYVVTLEDGRKIEGASKAEINAKIRTISIADKLIDVVLQGDPSIEADETVAKVCIALANDRAGVCQAYVVPRKKRNAD